MPVRHFSNRLSPLPLSDVSQAGDSDTTSAWLSASIRRHPRALIVGAGPNGLPFHKRIPPDCLKIALNSAITIPAAWDIWMVFDQAAVNCPWFKTKTTAVKIFGSELKRRGDYSFDYIPVIWVVNDLSPAVLHGGGSVAGCAVQLAYWLGCKRTTLLGIDQFGSKHFDGTDGAPKHMCREWSSMKSLEKIIKLVIARGMRVDTISKTRLSIPVVKLW